MCSRYFQVVLKDIKKEEESLKRLLVKSFSNFPYKTKKQMNEKTETPLVDRATHRQYIYGVIVLFTHWKRLIASSFTTL